MRNLAQNIDLMMAAYLTSADTRFAIGELSKDEPSMVQAITCDVVGLPHVEAEGEYSMLDAMSKIEPDLIVDNCEVK